MFTADGKRVLQEKHTGTVEEQLRSLTGETRLAELKVEQDKLGECIRLLQALVKDGICSVSKTLQSCLRLLKAYSEKIKDLSDKVVAHEDGFHLMTRNFFTDVNRLTINVPVQAQHRKAFTMPHEQDSRKKRKMPGPRRPEDRKGKRQRALKPQKVAGKQARKKKKPQLFIRQQQQQQQRAEPTVRWQDQLYRQPMESDSEGHPRARERPVPVKIEIPDPTRGFVVPVEWEADEMDAADAEDEMAAKPEPEARPPQRQPRLNFGGADFGGNYPRQPPPVLQRRPPPAAAAAAPLRPPQPIRDPTAAFALPLPDSE
jgi:hypothetical protein